METDAQVVATFIEEFHRLIRDSGMEMSLSQSGQVVRFHEDMIIDTKMISDQSLAVRIEIHNLCRKFIYGKEKARHLSVR